MELSTALHYGLGTTVLGRRARRAEVHRPQPPWRARLQHRLRVSTRVRVVQLAPVGLRLVSGRPQRASLH